MYLREHREPYAGRFDLIGFVLASVGFSLVMYALTQGSVYGWISLRILASLAVGVLALIALVVVELRLANPMIQPRLFGNHVFRTANLVSLFGQAGFIGLLFALPLFLQQGLGYSAFETGLSIFPEALGVLCSSQIVGRLYARVGPRRLMGFGLLWVAMMIALFCTVGPSTSRRAGERYSRGGWRERCGGRGRGTTAAHRVLRGICGRCRARADRRADCVHTARPGGRCVDAGERRERRCCRQCWCTDTKPGTKRQMPLGEPNTDLQRLVLGSRFLGSSTLHGWNVDIPGVGSWLDCSRALRSSAGVAAPRGQRTKATLPTQATSNTQPRRVYSFSPVGVAADRAQRVMIVGTTGISR